MVFVVVRVLRYSLFVAVGVWVLGWAWGYVAVRVWGFGLPLVVLGLVVDLGWFGCDCGGIGQFAADFAGLWGWYNIAYLWLVGFGALRGVGGF